MNPTTLKQTPKLEAIQCRLAEAKDQPAIYQLVKTIHAEFNQGFYDNDRHLDLLNIQQSYPTPKAAFFVWEDSQNPEQAIVGTGAIRQLDAFTAELRRFYALPKYRGTGLGRQINQTLIEFARQTGYEKIVLESHTDMPAAVKFYEKAGFHQIEPYAGEPLDYSNIAFAYTIK